MSAASFTLKHLGRIPEPIGKQRPVIARRDHSDRAAAIADLGATLDLARPGEVVELLARIEPVTR